LFNGPPTAAAVARLNDDQLRAVGLSSQKIRYMRDLSTKVTDGSVPLEKVNDLADEDVILSLTQVKGIGRWTAEMFLMFRLHRPDVLPVDDLGILKAVQRAYGLRKMPRPDRLTKIGEPWRPYRSVACWYLWASLGNKPNS
jgi:DNA-3-methyladenine glycosylase II